MIVNNTINFNLDTSIKSNVIKAIQTLPNIAIGELSNFIEFLKYKYLPDEPSSLWQAIEIWRSNIKLEDCDDDLSDAMINEWRSKEIGRNFSWLD